jgi:hypothetical protein
MTHQRWASASATGPSTGGPPEIMDSKESFTWRLARVGGGQTISTSWKARKTTTRTSATRRHMDGTDNQRLVTRSEASDEIADAIMRSAPGLLERRKIIKALRRMRLEQISMLHGIVMVVQWSERKGMPTKWMAEVIHVLQDTFMRIDETNEVILSNVASNN